MMIMLMMTMTTMMLGVCKAGCLCAGSRRGPCRSASTPLTATTTNPQAPYSASPPQVSTLHPIYSSGLVVAWNVAGLLITTTHSQTQAPPLLLCLDCRRGPATYISFSDYIGKPLSVSSHERGFDGHIYPKNLTTSSSSPKWKELVDSRGV